MKKENRLTALLFCFGIILGTSILTVLQVFHLDLFSWIFGLAVGWALRDTFAPIEKEIENNAEKVE